MLDFATDALQGLGRPAPRSLTAAHWRIVTIAIAAISDFAIVCMVFAYIAFAWRDADVATCARLTVAIATATLPFALLMGAFRPVVLPCYASAERAGISILCGGLLLVSIAWLTGARLPLGAGVFAVATVVAGGCVAIARLALAILVRRRSCHGPLARVVLHEPERPYQQIAPDALNVSGLFDPEHPTIEDYERLADLLHDIDMVVIFCASERRLLWAHALRGMNVAVEVCAPELSGIAPIALGDVSGQPTLRVMNSPLGIGERIAKRLFDVATAACAIILLSPALVAIAIAIKVDTPGPVLFLQPRIGRQNRVFRIYKFRSMTSERCDIGGKHSTSRDDKRVTRIGRFIRKTSLDELPQLFNVLFGHMSIVGPRPHAISSTAAGKLFWEVDGRYWSRHACKPGITGLAQVNGFRGATEHSEDLINRVSSDLQYLSRWSFIRDIAIILRTCKVLVHHNAY